MPDLTLELFAQPFISSVSHDNFKEFDAPRESANSVYGADVGEITSDGACYTIDPDGSGPAESSSIIGWGSDTMEAGWPNSTPVRVTTE